MNYSHKYLKLDNRIYTTIRRYRKPYQKIGCIEDECYNGCILHQAKIIGIQKARLSQIPVAFLILDCKFENSEINHRRDCYDLIQSFYNKEIKFSEEKFFIFLMERGES